MSFISGVGFVFFIVEKIITIVSKKESADNRAFWFQKTAGERLDALEFLRNQFIELIDAPKRLQRVFRIIERKRS
jgi:hypothetical protein